MKLNFPTFDPDLVEEIETYLDQHYQCEITEAIPYKAVDGVVLRARGIIPDGRNNLNTRNDRNYARPMIQVLDDNALGSMLTSGKAREHGTCQCYRFDQSWSCPEHPEVPWDAEWRQFVPPIDPRHPHAGQGVSVADALTAACERMIQRMPPAHADIQPPVSRTAMDRLLLLADFSMTVEGRFTGAFFENSSAERNIEVREHHDSEDRIVLRYALEDDRGDR